MEILKYRFELRLSDSDNKDLHQAKKRSSEENISIAKLIRIAIRRMYHGKSRNNNNGMS